MLRVQHAWCQRVFTVCAQLNSATSLTLEVLSQALAGVDKPKVLRATRHAKAPAARSEELHAACIAVQAAACSSQHRLTCR